MVITAAVNCSSPEVEAELRDGREATKATIAARIQADVDDGRLPADTDAEALATFYAVIIQGMSTQARDGASRELLERVAAQAMLAWPDSP
jgi:hypothetical protein